MGITKFIVLPAVLVSVVLVGCTGGHAAAGATWYTVTAARPVPLFYQASGLAVGPSGNVFLADSGDHRVKKYSPAGALLATWGTDSLGPLRFRGPSAIAVGTDGRIYVADNGIMVLSFTGNVVARWTGGGLTTTESVEVGAGGVVYALSTHDISHSTTFDRLTIMKLDRHGTRLGAFTFAYPQPFGARSAVMAVGPNGNVYLMVTAVRPCHDCNGTYSVLRILLPTGRTLALVPEDGGGTSISVATNGDIYSAVGDTVERLSSAGMRLETFPAEVCGIGPVGSALHLATSPSGTVWAAKSYITAVRPDHYPSPIRTGVLRQFALDGTPQVVAGACPPVGTPTRFGQVNGVAVDAHGATYVADGITGTVDRVLQGGVPQPLIHSPFPSAVATDRAGNIYVPDLQDSSLKEFAPDGRLLSTTAGVVLEATAIAPNGRVYGLTPFGEVLVLPPVGHGSVPLRHWWVRGYAAHEGGSSPTGICLDGAGNVWIADIRHNNVQKYTPTGHLLLIWGREGTAPNRFHNPNGLTVDGHGHLFVLDSANSRVQEFDLRGHFVAVYGREGEALGQLRTPAGIAADARGVVYVGDRGNDRVQALLVP